jgi:hypothetical protein
MQTRTHARVLILLNAFCATIQAGILLSLFFTKGDWNRWILTACAAAGFVFTIVFVRNAIFLSRAIKL